MKKDNRDDNKGKRSDPKEKEEKKEYNKKDCGKGKDRKDQKPPKEEGKSEPKKNDWRFYAINEQIAKDLGSIPYSNIPGVPHELAFDNGSVVSEFKSTFPGAIAILYDTAIGNATDATNGINMAAKQLYTKIRKMNSGAKNYEAADVMMYVLAMREIYAEYFECQRAIGLAQNYHFVNRNMPEVILTAAGINSQPLFNNIASLRGTLNVIATKINSFAMPNYFKAFMRDAVLSSQFFYDSSSRRSQCYIFRKRGYYTWSSTSSTTGSSLQYTLHTANGGAKISLVTRLNSLNNMIDALFNDTDVNTIAGDILKAFGDAKMFSVKLTGEDYIVDGVYDEDILAQIENMKTVKSCLYQQPGISTIDEITFSITQKNGLISNAYNLSPQAHMVISRRFLFNSHKDVPDYRDTWEWSRNMTVLRYVEADTIEIFCGLEMFWTMWYFTRFEGGTISGNELLITGLSNAGASSPSLANVCRLAQFDWHPEVEYITVDTYPATATTKVTEEFEGMDIKVYTYIDAVTLTNLHSNAVYAAFYDPDYAKLEA